MKRVFLFGLVVVTWIGTSGCFYSKWPEYLSPFQDAGPPSEHTGDTTNHTLLEETGGAPAETKKGSTTQAETARAALEQIRKYRDAQDPQPTYPVFQPAEVRLMWVPDHLNKFGDLVPAHYYYLKVLDDRPAVQDAFDLEDQLNASTRGGVIGGPGGGGATPWVYGDTKR